VDLRDPRKPEPPEVAQLNVLPLPISDGNDGVVKRRVNVRHTINDLLGDFTFGCLCIFCHKSTRFNIDATKSDVAPPKWSSRFRMTAFLPTNGLSRPLPGSRVGLGTLAAQRQALSMTQPAITTQIH
jgi:hypothetical protein